MNVLIVLLIPLIGTCLGSAMVFFMKNTINNKLEKFLIGFSSGIMISASIFSLLMPSINLASEQNITEWLPASIGFLFGIFFLLLLDILIPHLHTKTNETEGIKSKLKRTTKMVLAVTLHNIPEGMAVGVTLAGVIYGNVGLSLAGAFVLAIGIAIQNFPEGAIIAMPLKLEGNTKAKSFGYGVLSGIVEPISAMITIGITNKVLPILPYLLAFAAGAMMYVVVEELIPQLQEKKHSNIGVIGVAIGFVIMMILDIALG